MEATLDFLLFDKWRRAEPGGTKRPGWVETAKHSQECAGKSEESEHVLSESTEQSRTFISTIKIQ